MFNEKFEKRSIVNISRNKKHPTCGARAIIVALANMRNYKYYNNIRNPKRREQYDMAFELLRLLDLPTDREIEIRDFKLFEDLLDIQIIVYNRPFSDGCIYAGAGEKKSKIFLYYEKNHFDVITSITGFLGRNYYCDTCRVPYSNLKKHCCEVRCRTCEYKKCLTENLMACRKCHQLCRSLECFTRHQQMSGKKKINSLCDRYFACTKCSIVLPSKEKFTHVCHTRKCRQCHQKVPSAHLCYMRAKSPKVTNGRFLYFDFECNAEKIMNCTQGYKKKVVTDCTECTKLGFVCFSCLKCANCDQRSCNAVQHRPNFVVSQTVCRYCEYNICTPESKCMHCGRRCKRCWDIYKKSDKKYDCRECCGFRETVFKGENTLPAFMQYLFSPQNNEMTIVAHNGGKYDYSFILEWILSELHVGVKTIYSGAQIKSITINEYKMRFIDSILFFSMALRNLPKSFDLQSKKGEFPHLFNLEKNYAYIGPYPEISFYSPDTMSKECRDTFLKWHANQRGKIFDFQKEILEYCRADVSVLRESCTKFRCLMMELTCDSVQTGEDGIIEYVGSVDPLASMTLAGMCLNVFRTKFLKEDYRYIDPPTPQTTPSVMDSENHSSSFDSEILDTTPPVEKKQKKMRVFDYSPIGIIPPGGYSVQDNYSKKSLLWLELIAKRTKCRIQHALNGGEFRVGGDTNYRVDGWCENTNTVYEFYGDVWHGCPLHTGEIKGWIGGISPACRYAMTIDRMNVLKKMGYNLVTIWECDFDVMVKKLKTEEKDFLEKLDFVERLDIRNAFYGGRTNCIVLHMCVKGDDVILYYDVTSLYPAMQKFRRYPLYHPIVITSDFLNIFEYFGFATVRVLPPTNLYHPVLPYRATGKLKFTLCKICAETENIKGCKCNESGKSFVGTFATPELQEALLNGYTILKIYEVLHYPYSTQYDPETREGGLFTPYVNTFLKLKTEASGFPASCVTEADKKAFIDDFYEKEGILLDYDKIVYNAGLRLIAKSLLNNLWGRLGLSCNLPKTTFVRTPEEFLRIVNDQGNVIKDFHVINDDTLGLVHEKASGALEEDNTSNVALAAFTTCYGRLELYKYLKQLDKRVLYFDTDSIIFTSSPLVQNPPPLITTWAASRLN